MSINSPQNPFTTLNNPFHGPVFWIPSCSSTMLLAQDNVSDGALFITNFQTAGRGRLTDRAWQSDKAANLTFTLCLNNQHFNAPPTLVTALGLAHLLKNLYNLHPSIKWPNDVLIHNKKIAGILCQNYSPFILIGIGFNINQLYFNEDFKATSLSLATNKASYDRAFVLQALLNQLKLSYKQDDWQTQFNQLLWGKDSELNYNVGTTLQPTYITGQPQLVASDGALLVKVSGQQALYKIYAGEVAL